MVVTRQKRCRRLVDCRAVNVRAERSVTVRPRHARVSYDHHERPAPACLDGNPRVLIRDVKSSNGTFVNGERLSLEGVESAPWKVRSDDILEFGIDIIGEQGEMVHRKVAARATCAFTEAEAQ
ncbi:hypothetical protein C8F01DRAFT_991851, partial [Mycena amicta]